MNTSKKSAIVFIACSISATYCMQPSILETNHEFADRTLALPASKQYTNPLSNYFIEPRGASLGYYITCPFNIYRGALRPASNNQPSQLLVITSEGDVRARQFLDHKNVIALALSSNPDIFARVYRKSSQNNPHNTTDILKIQRVDTKQTIKKIVLPKLFEIATAHCANQAIAFNKQGTAIIVWGIESLKRGSYKKKVQGTPALDWIIYNLND